MSKTISSPVDADERLPALEASLGPLEDELLTPALVIDLGAVEHNATAVIKRIGSAKRWRPHVKTIKQARLVKMLMQKGVTSLKCATIDELALCLDTAERVHPEGEVDVLFAYPASRNTIRGIVELGRNYEGGTIRLLADSPNHLEALSGWLDEAGARGKTSVMLDVDVGMHRTGTSAAKWREAAKTIAKVKKVEITGLHGYEGHIGWDDAAAAKACYDELVELAGALPDKSVRFIVTSGSHAFPHALDHDGLAGGPWKHDVSPGTLVLSDRRSAPAAEALGLQQAIFVVSRVVSTPGDGRVTLDAGSKSLAPDCPPPACSVVRWPQLEPLEASEEHRPVAVHGDRAPGLGDRVWLVPDHACTTVNLHKHVIYVRDGKYVNRGTVEAMSRTLTVKDRRP